jgi:hypothetical protein
MVSGGEIEVRSMPWNKKTDGPNYSARTHSSRCDTRIHEYLA